MDDEPIGSSGYVKVIRESSQSVVRRQKLEQFKHQLLNMNMDRMKAKDMN